MVGLWGAGDYTFVLARLGPLHLGCNREVAALLRWLLTQVSLYPLTLAIHVAMIHRMSVYPLIMQVIFTDFDETSSVSATRKAIKRLRSDFKTLVKLVKKILIGKHDHGELKYADFKEDIIFDLPESIRDQIQKDFEKKSKEFSHSSNYDELFLVLNTFWDYLNPFLLQHVISNNCDEQLQSEMEEYLEKLRLFMNATNLDIFYKALPPSDCKLPRTTSSSSRDMKEVITKHELSHTDTLQRIDDIRTELRDAMRLTGFALFVAAKLGPGSVIIMWYVTARVARMFAELEQRENMSFKIISPEGTYIDYNACQGFIQNFFVGGGGGGELLF